MFFQVEPEINEGQKLRLGIRIPPKRVEREELSEFRHMLGRQLQSQVVTFVNFTVLIIIV